MLTALTTSGSYALVAFSLAALCIVVGIAFHLAISLGSMVGTWLTKGGKRG